MTPIAGTEIVEPEQLLESMYRFEPQLGTDGVRHEMQHRQIHISREQGSLIAKLHAQIRPMRTLEIGLGYGFSTTYLLMAMQRSGIRGNHIAIDPMQGYFHGIGATRATVLGMQDQFKLVQARSAVALPRLSAEGYKCGLIFIDGDHRFDCVLVDFFLSDAICAPNGIIVFDDLWMPAVQRVIDFIRTNRSDFSYIAQDVKNAAVFQKTGRDERPWDDFIDF